MTDLETRLRALADAASSVATQPTTDELLAKPQPVKRKWLPAAAIAAATAAVMTLAVVGPWASSPPQPGAGQESCPGKTAVLEVSAPDAQSANSVVREALARVGAVSPAPCVVRHGNETTIFVDAAATQQLMPELIGPASVARVQSFTCPSDPTAAYGNVAMPTADGKSCVLVGSPEVPLDGHVRSTSGGGASYFDLTVGVDDATATRLQTLAASINNRRAIAAATPADVAIVMGDRVIGVMATADMTTGLLSLPRGLDAATFGMAVHLRDRTSFPAGTTVTALTAAPCASDVVVYRFHGGATPPDALLAMVRARVATLTTDACVRLDNNGSVVVHLGSAGRKAVSLALLRSDLWVAPVTAECQPDCSSFDQGKRVFIADASVDLRGDHFTVDQGRKTVLDSHIQSVAATLSASAEGWIVDIQLDATATAELGALTAETVGKPSPTDQLAYIDHGTVIVAPVIEGAITDGHLQVTGLLSEQEANVIAHRLDAPGVPADVQIDVDPASPSTQ